MEQQFVVNSQETGQRLDLFCVAKLPGMSRSAIQKAIKAGTITVNGAVVPGKKAVREGEAIVIKLAPAEPMVLADQSPPSLAIPMLYEDREVVVIAKPAGVSMYSASHEPTVATWFTEH